MPCYFAIAARGVELVTAAELTRLGAHDVKPAVGGVSFEGDLALLYRAVLGLRTATRILRPLREFAAVNPEMLYSQTRRVRWEDYLDPRKTLAVYATIEGASSARPPAANVAPAAGRRGPRVTPDRRGERRPAPAGINHSQFAALKIKDAIVDRLRREQGARPDVDTQNPDIRVQAHFAGGRCTLSLDACGASLHERGYRLKTTMAPLKETLAAAIIELSEWQGATPLLDPMCGSGTLVIEAALKALRIAPGLLRTNFACQRWPDYDGAVWSQIEQEARGAILRTPPAIIEGSDIDPRAIDTAIENARRAGVTHAVKFEVRGIDATHAPAGEPGIIVVNPPYGTRMGEVDELEGLYRQLGELWKERFPGWTAFLLAGNPALAREVELVAAQKFKLFNGGLDCKLLRFDIAPEAGSATSDPAPHEPHPG